MGRQKARSEQTRQLGGGHFRKWQSKSPVRPRALPGFSEMFDKKLKDPVWETVSLKIKKYKPFLNINVFQFKKILREIIHE